MKHLAKLLVLFVVLYTEAVCGEARVDDERCCAGHK